MNELWAWYIRQLEDNGHGAIGKTKSFYDTFDNGTKIEKDMRVTYRESPELQRVFPNPFSTDSGKGVFKMVAKRQKAKTRHQTRKDCRCAHTSAGG